ncbi:hypothetical protein [Halobacillus ihumii]|uniref:hypothetical protein n=1 Tax=Halobacillus ihumii TaxID=2686092 RepID=UPI0013D5B50C|nr:hypothetical protein [Halobacillus ihumii]
MESLCIEVAVRCATQRAAAFFIGHAGCFSTQPYKHINSGEGSWTGYVPSACDNGGWDDGTMFPETVPSILCMR